MGSLRNQEVRPDVNLCQKHVLKLLSGALNHALPGGVGILRGGQGIQFATGVATPRSEQGPAGEPSGFSMASSHLLELGRSCGLNRG